MRDQNVKGSFDAAVRCGIVLAAGDGRRMRDFVFRQRGDYLPKQYINFVGKRSMLEHTFDRAEQLIPADRLFVVIADEHRAFPEVRQQLLPRPRGTVIAQPQNKDTAPGVLLPLLYLHKEYPEAILAVFPSDHFVLEENLFMSHVERAFRLVEADRSRIVLLGIEANAPDPEYGYIVPGKHINKPERNGAREVEVFVEKPSAAAAKTIIDYQGLWNSLVFIAASSTLLQMIQNASPELSRCFSLILEAMGSPEEKSVIEEVYREIPSINFSKEILENLSLRHRRALLVLPVSGVTWSDWGVSDRLLRDTAPPRGDSG
ncbi:MAG TPA: sugar phosphate nucleotidyltransferase [Candidatus Binatia bacterium]|jgi:mannose-1-phosphate guanylyltransferase